MNEATARAMIQEHFDASNVGAGGGGPGDDIVRASEIYADDAVVEWPQGGERLRGKANIIGFRSTYPARQQFELHRTTGCHDLWVNEYTIRYDGQPVMVVGIMEFRDEKVVRERFDPWERTRRLAIASETVGHGGGGPPLEVRRPSRPPMGAQQRWCLPRSPDRSTPVAQLGTRMARPSRSGTASRTPGSIECGNTGDVPNDPCQPVPAGTYICERGLRRTQTRVSAWCDGAVTARWSSPDTTQGGRDEHNGCPERRHERDRERQGRRPEARGGRHPPPRMSIARRSSTGASGGGWT
jgi:SnoaL-like domain